MANAGGLKLAAKRTAFGDVSNTVNISRPSKDDSALGGKGDFGSFEKAIPSQQEKKTTSFLRPAQRPLSVSGLKPSTSSLPNTSNQPYNKQSSVDVQQPPQPLDTAANTRKILTKKSTAISKDVAPTPSDRHVLDPQIPLTSVAPIAPVHRELQPIQQSKPLEEHQDFLPRLTREPRQNSSAREPNQEAGKPQSIQTSSEKTPALRSDGIYIDEQGQVQLYDYIDPVELPEVAPVEMEAISNLEVSKQIGRTSNHQDPEAPIAKLQPLRKSTLTTVSEPEEYWDDEGEENYDEEGYVTARSFKSRGENTTGGATTVLFPKVNLKAKKELAAAKELIESLKTVEELEDEAWDTTMVAEYGEEIFRYMRDLEV